MLVLPHARMDADAEASAREFEELARSAGAEVLERIGARVDPPSPRYYIGSGKADELKTLVQALDANLVLVDHALSPVQERNLELTWAFAWSTAPG